MANEKRNCNQICHWNDSSDGCIKPSGRICPMSNTEPDASGWGQVKVKNEKRLIDANALMDEFRKYIADRHDRERCVSDENCNTCERECLWRRVVKAAPTVDAVEVVHGRWEYGKWEQWHWVKGNERCRCSVCHRDFAVDNANIWNGCPHCLAKMDGDGNGAL